MYRILDEFGFIEELCHTTRNGRGLVPLVGGGISAASGIPVVAEIRDYLGGCILMALRGDEPHTAQSPWTPSEPWPPLDSFHESEHNFDDIGTKKLSTNRIWQSGYGAAADWRRALDFLSRLRCDRDGRLDLGPPRSDVIDSFFRHITADRLPNLAHKMLAALAGAGKLQLLLTINFDELIEAAHEEAQIPLTTIALNRGATLPPHETFWPDLTLLKLHGGRYGLRADDSLDEPPTAEELSCFVEYFMVPSTAGAVKESVGSADLFVAGTSLDDARLRTFVRELLERDATSPPCVYWTYYSDTDEQRVLSWCREVTAELERKRESERRPEAARKDDANEGERTEEEPRIFLHKSKDVGLLLLHFYQVLQASLPRSGVIVPSAASVPWPPAPALSKPLSSRPDQKWTVQDPLPKFARQITDELTLPDRHSDGAAPSPEPEEGHHVAERPNVAVRRFESLLERMRDGIRQGREATHPYLLALLGSTRYQGLTSIAAAVFEEIVDEGEPCIWLDMDDAASTDDLFEQLRTALAVKAHAEDWTPGLVGTSGQERARELARYTKAIPKRWHVFLNAREGAGLNAPTDHSKGSPNGWLDHVDVGDSPSGGSTVGAAGMRTDSCSAFCRLVEGLMGAELKLTLVLIGTGSWVPEPSTNDSGRQGTESTDVETESQETTVLLRELSQRLIVKREDWDDGLQGTIGDIAAEPRGCAMKPKPVGWLGQIIGTQTNLVGFQQRDVLRAIHDRESGSGWLPAGQGSRANTDENGESPRNTPAGDTEWGRWRFLVALTLMHRARHRSAAYGHAFRWGRTERHLFPELPIPSSSTAPSNDDPERGVAISAAPATMLVDRWIAELENCRLVRMKPGGFLWLHSKTRDRLRVALLDDFRDRFGTNVTSTELPEKNVGRVVTKYGLTARTVARMVFASAHMSLARWQRRILDSSGDSSAVLDGLHHCCQAATEMSRAFVTIHPRNKRASRFQQELDERMEQFMLSALADAESLLTVARGELVSKGASTGKCRRLEELVNNLMEIVFRMTFLSSEESVEDPDDGPRYSKLGSETSLKRLNLHRLDDPDTAPQRGRVIAKAMSLRSAIYRAMSQIAREIGETPTAYKRLRQWAESSYQSFVRNPEDGLCEYVNPKCSVKRLWRDWQILREGIGSVRDELTRPLDQQQQKRLDSYREQAKKHRVKLLEKQRPVWMSYQRGVATAHIASRAYYDAQVVLYRLLEQARPAPPNSGKPAWAKDDRFRSDEWFRSRDPNEHDLEEWSTTSAVRLIELLQRTHITLGLLIGESHRLVDLAVAREALKACHRQMQLVVCLAELRVAAREFPIGWFPEERSQWDESSTHSRWNLWDDVRSVALGVGRTTYELAAAIVGLNHADTSGSLLAEMQRIETFSAALHRLEEHPRLAARAVDHAVAWLRSASAPQLPRAIAEIESVSQCLANAGVRFVRDETASPTEHPQLHEVLVNEVLPTVLRDPGPGEGALGTNDGGPQLNYEFETRTVSVGDYVRGRLAEVCPKHVLVGVGDHADGTREPPEMEKGFATAYGVLGEAAQRIKRATKLLASQPKSVWWITKLYELQLTRLRSEIELGVFDRRWMPPEIEKAVRRDVPTVVEEVFSEVRRLLRNDTVRLGRCLQLLADCTFGLWLFRFQQGQVHGLRRDPAYDRALSRMLEHLKDGDGALQRMRSFHEQAATKQPPYRSQLTDDYVNHVSRHVDRVSMCLSVTTRRDV